MLTGDISLFAEKSRLILLDTVQNARNLGTALLPSLVSAFSLLPSSASLDSFVLLFG